jgi:SAM-dependent methyltransferase
VEFYRNDLAYIHDDGFGGIAASAAPVLLDSLQRAGLTSGLVIDLGCGSGILSEAVSAAGYDVLGIDLSRAMLRLARQRVPKGQFRQASFLTADLPSCVAVAAIGEIFNYLFDDGNTEEALSGLFRRVYAALRPGGSFLLDLAGPGRVRGTGPQNRFWEGEDWAVLVTTEEEREQRILTRHITSFRRVGKRYRRDHEVHRQRLFPPAEAAASLRQAGFRVRILKSYGERHFAPGHTGFLARKPAAVISAR